MSDRELVLKLKRWVEVDAPGSFNSDFVFSVYEYFERLGRISDRQRRALQNIVDKYEVSLEDYV